MAEAEKVMEISRKSSELSDEWDKKWFLSLAVANGAGCVGLTSALVNTIGKGPVYGLVAGLWSFAIGLCLSGCLPYLLARRHSHLANYHSVVADETREGGPTVYHGEDWEDDVESTTASDFQWRRARRYGSAIKWAQFLSAAGFGLGILLPLIQFTIIGIFG